ncbi:MAG: hypothetical protein Fur006_62830 [Coleofasciculaceae cyanobacterium]
MNKSFLTNPQIVNPKKDWLKLRYRALQSGTYDKFEAWIMTIEDRWADEIADCLQGKFPDWRE